MCAPEGTLSTYSGTNGSKAAVCREQKQCNFSTIQRLAFKVATGMMSSKCLLDLHLTWLNIVVTVVT